jgi:hypothetical protein
MNHVLNSRERQALDRMTLDHRSFHIKAGLGTGIGTKTIDVLLSLGLVEAGPNARHHGEIGWRLTADGWRCMYGKTIEEIMAPGGKPVHPLRVWSWPPIAPEQSV